MTERISNHEAISAFIDNEPFDAHELASALATPGGRELLLDLIAMRHVVLADITPESAVTGVVKRAPWRRLAAAAAIVIALAGAYAAGRQFATNSGTTAMDAPPAPTKVIELRPGIDWHVNNGGK